MSVTLDVELREERRRILAVVDGHLDEVVETAVDAIRADIPVYGDAPAALTADVRGHIARALPHEGRLPGRRAARHDRGARVLERRRDAARPRRRRPRGLHQRLPRRRTACSGTRCSDCAGSGAGGREAALTLATPLMRYCEVASTYAGHVFAEYLQRAVADADRERRELLEQLLAGELPGARAAARARAAATASRRTRGCSPSSRSPAGPAGRRRRGRRRARPRRARRHPDARRRAPGGDRGGGRARARLRDAQGVRARRGAARAPARGGHAAGARRQHRRRTASPSCRARSPRRAPRWSACDGDGGVAALPLMSPLRYLTLSAPDTARRLVDPRLRTFLERGPRARRRAAGHDPRARRDRPQARRGGRAACRCTRTRSQYRVRRIQERTGRNPRRVADLLELLTAIALDDG